ncbi:MAG: hypothetical protein HFJ41_03665 [Clostridia bacterium]|nr:hypothetical protein [Clostridia bacterium]
MGKDNKLQANINNFVEERIQESYANLVNTKEYNNLLKNYYDLFSKIEKLLNNEKLTEQYKEAEYDVYMFQLEEAYKIGFYDSTIIFNQKNDNV